jgi:hypothetical protein
MRDVDRAGADRVEDAALAEQDCLVRRIVEKHGQHGIAGASGFGGGSGNLGASRSQRIGVRAGPVPNCYFVPGLKQPPSHVRAHIPQSKKRNLHAESPFTESLIQASVVSLKFATLILEPFLAHEHRETQVPFDYAQGRLSTPSAAL